MERKKRKILKNGISLSKANFKRIIHLNYIFGLLYAFYHFIRTPKGVNMQERRLWAYETWIILTLYSLFIYLFLIEKAAEDGEPIFYKMFRIRRKVLINASEKKVLDYFKHISKNPSDYSFETHAGIFPVKGNFTKPDSIFKTKEKFLKVPVELTFKTLNTEEKNSFDFQLVYPFKRLDICGRFHYIKVSGSKTRLYLTVFSETADILNHLFLIAIFIFPLRMLIAKQLQKELRFIKKEIKKEARVSQTNRDTLNEGL